MVNLLKDILLLQKKEVELRLSEPYKERFIDSKKLASPLIKVIMGPRRAGKSFFALHFLSGKGNFGYVNFDDEKLVEVNNYDEIVEAVNSLYGNPKTLLLDEIQNLSKWELFVNRLQRQGYNLLITGSNSNLLSRELATHLTGRHVSVHLFPFSFKELTEEKELTNTQIKEKLDQFLFTGGYPEPLIKELDVKDYLSTLFDSIIFKDVVKRYNIRSPQGMEDLASYLLSNIANEYSYHSLSKVAKITSSHTVEKYLAYLEEAFIFFSLQRFSYKVKEQLSSNKKIYSIDNGFVSAKAFKASPDFGKLYENIVAQELKKDEMNNKIKLYYWKNQQQEEVDFLIYGGNKVKQLVQVCYSLANVKTKDREIRALLKAGKELHCKKLLIITDNYETEASMEWFDIKGKIIFMPLWKWLLERK